MPRERSRTRDRAALALLAATAALLLCFHAALADPADVQQRALRGHLTPKRSAADCAHVLRLTPEEAAELGWFHYHRALTDCKDVDELLNDDIKTPAEKDKDKTKATIDNEFKNTIDGREGWKPTTPDEIKARADAEARDKKLAADQAELDAKQAEFAKQQAATEALVKANEAKRKEYLEQLQKESEARAAEVQKVHDARNQAELDRVQKLNDDIRAAQDAKTREQHAAAEKADLERQKADQDARAAENERLAKDKAQRDADKLQQEVDERQAEADKQSADEEQKAKNAAQRQQNAETRAANEQARQQRETEFRANEEARLARERDAEAARLEREKTEADIKKEEEARAQREKNLDENQKALAAREKEFAEADAARADQLKKMKEDEDARAAEEQKVRDADKDKADEIDGKQKDLDKQNEEIPNEEKPKRDDEDDCDSSSGDKVTCHNGGKCFQLRSDPSKKRCKCEKGYKGEKCEYAPCSETGADKKVKTGNMVDKKCMRWDSEYNCPGCDKNWNLVVQCVEIGPMGKEKNVSSHDCGKMKKPENEFKDEMCKYCLTGCSIEKGTRHLREEVTTLPPTTGDQYRYAPACGSFPDRAFIYSTVPHVPEGTGDPAPAQRIRPTTKEGCLEQCWRARGRLNDRRQYYNGMHPMGAHHCTWVTWSGNDETCRLYFSGRLPVPAEDKTSRRGGRMMAFASFTRRFDISRGSQCDPSNRRVYPVGGQHHVVCIGNGRREGEGTFYLGISGTGPTNSGATQCPATYGTMLDAALHFEELSREPQELVRLVQVPGRLRHLSAYTAQQFQVVSGSSGLPWEYTVDFLGRVVTVSAVTLLPPSIINGDGREQVSPSEYQKIFNYEMYNKRVGRLFQAGHLVAAAQKPPNFFFNYVPQHASSNSQGGCWWFAEIAASDFQRMGCHISYDVALTYPKEGDTPKQTGENRPPWVKTLDRPSSYENLGDTPPFEPKCHFRYRPVTMGLTFRINDAAAGTTCANLVASRDPRWNGGAMVQVREADGHVFLITSRVNAYLLQKWTLGQAADRGPPTNRQRQQFRKLFSVATAMANDLKEVKCFAETGYFFPFHSIVFTPEFQGAFISTLYNDKCVTYLNQVLYVSGNPPDCPKWSSRSPAAVTTQDPVPTYNEIYFFDEASGTSATDCFRVVQEGVAEPLCAKFVYYRDPRDDTYDRTRTQEVRIEGTDQSAASAQEMYLDNLVEGTLEAGDKCALSNLGAAVSGVHSVNVLAFGDPGENKVNCLAFRVSYYPLHQSIGDPVDITEAKTEDDDADTDKASVVNDVDSEPMEVDG